MAEIEDFTGRDAKTILKMIEHENFPAKFICGRWQAVPEDILKWFREHPGDSRNGKSAAYSF